MTTAVWPAGLPQRVLVNGYQERAPKIMSRTPMDAGIAKARRRFTAAPKLVDCQFRMTSAQVDTLMAFFNDTLAGGTLPFTWLHPRTQINATWRFLEEPIASPIDVNWFVVACKLEQLP
jgi:hypothetical protein